MITSGAHPTPQARIINVRYRRGGRTEATANDPAAPPNPNAPNATANAPAPPPVWSFTAKGSSTSMGSHRHQHQDDREQQGGEHPPGADHVDETVAKVDTRGDDGMTSAIEVPADGGASHRRQHRHSADL